MVLMGVFDFLSNKNQKQQAGVAVQEEGQVSTAQSEPYNGIGAPAHGTSYNGIGATPSGFEPYNGIGAVPAHANFPAVTAEPSQIGVQNTNTPAPLGEKDQLQQAPALSEQQKDPVAGGGTPG